MSKLSYLDSDHMWKRKGNFFQKSSGEEKKEEEKVGIRIRRSFGELIIPAGIYHENTVI